MNCKQTLPRERVHTAEQTPNHSPEGGIHRIFESAAAKFPERPALRFEGHTLTYEQLNRAANQLARHLVDEGIKPGDLVGLYFERSVEMVVAILAVLKAGAAYVPMDPAYPKERRQFILQDSRTSLLLTHESVLNSLPKTEVPVLFLDAQWQEFAHQSAENLKIDAAPDSVAYVIYTSGSTGNPKGVLVTHHNVARLFEQTEQWYSFNHQDVWTLFHSYAFDFSVWEIWGALFYGGALVVVPYAVSRTPEEFVKLAARERVTVLSQTPSAFRQFIWAEGNASERDNLSLRYVIFGGEALELQSLGPWFERHGDRKPRLVNMYGITETTVHVTYRPIERHDLAANLGSVIGCPIPDLEIHLLDENLKPVAEGQPGEICVGGAGVALGYLNRPELTRERFIAHPLGKGGKLYRSGDLARRLPGGDLEYLGRIDSQVKIRGFRIELGEIEANLNRLPGIKESVVVALEGAEGEKRLVAYLSTSGARPSVDSLREQMAQRLPGYMIPAVFVFLEKLPLTTNGKVDRRALPAPEKVRPEMAAAYTGAATPAEAILVKIWQEVLDIEGIGTGDNFFDLGGDSIRSIQVLARSKEQGLHFTLQTLFQNPTIKDLARHTSSHASAPDQTEPFSLISPEDRAKLPVGLEDAYPTVQLQQGMLFHSEMNRASAVFHDIFSFHLERPLDAGLMRMALKQVVSRHAILRTSFDLGSCSTPMQLVHREVEPPFSAEDLSGLDARQQREALEQWIEREKRRPLDWKRAPVARFHAQKQGPGSFQFIISFHHAILDGWSLAALMTEIFQDYTALLEKSGAPQPPVQIPYREYVRLERDALSAEDHRRFWTDKMQGAVVQTLPRWPKEMRQGGLEQVRGPEIKIRDEILEKLRDLAKTQGVPLRTVLLAAHFKVLQSLGGQEDLISGLIANGRPEEADGERMIGLFLNAVPVRLRLAEGSWRDLVRSVFQAEQEVLPHRRFPLAEIQKAAGRQSLFETAFDFVHFHVYKKLQGSSTRGFMEGHYFEANNFTLLTTFMLDVTSSHLQMHFDYDPEQLCPEQIALMCEYYVNTLEAMAAAPADRYASFSPLGREERQRVVWQWNDTECEYRQEVCIHQLFEEQARRTPDALAVIAAGRTLTYRELNAEADRLSWQLRGIGVGPGDHVAVHLERRAEMIVAVLGILKAGAAYVPLEPAYPDHRIEAILNALNCPAAVTEAKYANRFATLGGSIKNLILTDDLVETSSTPRTTIGRSQWLQAQEAAGAPQLFAGDVAYVIFTSGSTGTPKGVVVRHQPVVNLIEWVNRTFSVSGQDRLLFVTSLCFDLSVYDIFGILAAGGSVRVAQEPEIRDPERLLNILVNEPITFWDSAPAALQQLTPLFPKLGPAQNRGLRLVFLSGDWIPVSLPDQIRDAFPNAQIVSLGGATEATVWSNFYPIQKVDPRWPSIPYGKPVQNARYYILDRYLNPVPTGVAGDLYIGGDCLASGYVDAQQTAERFISDPFHGGKMYKTGDLARYLPDGNMEFLGRTDFQVKVRGFRIELGEIETVLRQHPKVQEVVVLARADSPGDKRLVAYVIPKGETPPLTAEEIKEQAKGRLPEYMIPAAVVFLERFPVSANGKLDRKALPAPDWKSSSQAFASPRTPIEMMLASIWSEVLGVERVGLHDDFVELGGHSLLAIQLISRLRETFAADIPLRTLVQAPTIARFAEAILSESREPARLERTAGMWMELATLSDEQLEERWRRTGKDLEAAS